MSKQPDPCRLCGGESELVEAALGGGEYIRCMVVGCGIETPIVIPGEALKIWHRRLPPPAITYLIEAEREQLRQALAFVGDTYEGMISRDDARWLRALLEESDSLRAAYAELEQHSGLVVCSWCGETRKRAATFEETNAEMVDHMMKECPNHGIGLLVKMLESFIGVFQKLAAGPEGEARRLAASAVAYYEAATFALPKERPSADEGGESGRE